VLETQRVRRLGGGQEFPVNVRVLACTNRDASAAVADGQLREDLYYRLNVFGVKLPPLRDRLDDLPLLIPHFLAEFDRKYRVQTPGIREDAMGYIYGHSWPGNVRELRNALERAVILSRGGWIERDHLPKDVIRCSPVSPAAEMS
jgi:DNA-binding NtrC family response regulator